jgi:hypothetical protein
MVTGHAMPAHSEAEPLTTQMLASASPQVLFLILKIVKYWILNIGPKANPWRASISTDLAILPWG